ncbi:MAG TPA: class I SAM-dependent methyltransferase [Sphingopyxis sp.]|uniref:class I SAM-dependent methyltransferase n=1 Tax=Sphingopyxis sp. TaxID=1908224 RepID=UPI002E2F72D4|nr:class I SAM-dependent methyltransferase [Sphingopyxis sp.]HEX2813230.1 class I SAM-dependent methyltransferase [Sphingopyxis sp.]
MQLVKRSYAGFMHALANLGPFEKLTHDAKHHDPYGWRRWSASLLAIHDIDRMIALGLPWWNVAATREAETFLHARTGARVFEYGAGASTVWLSQHAGEVISVEHHEEWHRRLRPAIQPFAHASLWHRALEGTAYIDAIMEAGGLFDLIVIDGRRRTECLTRAITRLKPDGMILFDDSGRRRYRRAIEQCGLSEHRHFGRSYCVPYPDFTSLLRD